LKLSQIRKPGWLARFLVRRVGCGYIAAAAQNWREDASTARFGCHRLRGEHLAQSQKIKEREKLTLF
jgi:hypothetical protein